jgi:hypothetical protein
VCLRRGELSDPNRPGPHFGPTLGWHRIARLTVGALRMNAGRHPDDPKPSTLIGDLSVRSPEFGRLWSSHDVREKRSGTKRFCHPFAGEIAIAY